MSASTNGVSGVTKGEAEVEGARKGEGGGKRQALVKSRSFLYVHFATILAQVWCRGLVVQCVMFGVWSVVAVSSGEENEVPDGWSRGDASREDCLTRVTFVRQGHGMVDEALAALGEALPLDPTNCKVLLPLNLPSPRLSVLYDR